MRHTDIAIVGGGLAGSTAAAMLGRAGLDAILIDPHEVYPTDFRCEKLDELQVALLKKTGLASPVLRASTHDEEVWIARFGRMIEKRRVNQYDLFYDTLVNTLRAEIPACVPFICGKVVDLTTTPDRQKLSLSNGDEVCARLIVLANGLNVGLRQKLNMQRKIMSAGHSISIGFDLKPLGQAHFNFRAQTYYAEKASDRIAYLALFPIGETMRANFFVYRDIHDPWVRQLRETPKQILFATMPGLRELTGDFAVTSFIKIRPVDLYVTTGFRQAGIVLLGDAFATSCPAAGTGCNKVFTDVERLCNHHVHNWLGTPGIGRDKIESFYDDPEKQACDEYSTAKAYFLRSLSTEAGLAWQARRWARFVGGMGIGSLRQARQRLTS